MTDHRAIATFAPNVNASASVRIESVFSWLAFSAIYLQKINVPGLGGDFGVDHMILWTILASLMIHGVASVHPLRLMLYLATICCTLVSLVLEQSVFSVPSLILFLIVNATVLVVTDVEYGVMLRCYKSFQALMVPIAYIVIGQQVIQFTIGNAYWPNLNTILPDAVVMQGSTYLRPMAWQSPYFIPNGVFFLEPSTASLFLAVSTAVEIVWLKRFKHLCLFGSVLVISMTGTGITELALLSPALIAKMDPRLRRLAIRFGIPFVLFVAATGAMSYFAQRSEEFSDPNSSAYARMYIPFRSTIGLFTDPSYLISGMGPGSTPKSPESRVTWPSSKLAYEYSTLTAIAFHVFLLLSVLGNATCRVVALVGTLPTLFFGGGFLSAPNTMIMVMFGSLLRLRDQS